MLPLQLERAVFNAPRNTLTRYGATVFKVTAITPGGPTPLKQQRATAWEILSSEAQRSAISAFEAEFRSRWRPRTTCAPAVRDAPGLRKPPNGRVTPSPQGQERKLVHPPNFRTPRCSGFRSGLCSTAANLPGARSPVVEGRGVDVRCGGHGWSSAPGVEGGARERSLPAVAGAGAADRPVRGCERGLPVDGA